MKLTDKITALSGVAAKRSELYAKMGIATVGDLLDHLPREYTDFSEPVNIADAPLNEQEADFVGLSDCYQLYNVKDDPGQRNNLATKESRRLRQMMMRFEQLKRETGKKTNF